MFKELQAASFVSPEKQELFLSFSETRNGIHTWCYVVDFSDGAASIIFDSDWTSAAFSAEGSFLDWFRVEVSFPELFDSYIFFIKNPEREKDYIQAGIYDAATGNITKPREIYGSYLTAASPVVSPIVLGGSSLAGLQLSFAVAGASWGDILGSYVCYLRYHSGKWALQGDMQLEGIQNHRTEKGMPVKDMAPAWTMRGVEKKLPMPLATVQRVEGKAAFDALQEDYAIVGTFDENAADTWLFVPLVTPSAFIIHGAEDTGGQLVLTEVQEQYPLSTGQAFVYSRTWRGINEIGDLERQYIISIRHGDDKSEHHLWVLPEAGDGATYVLRPGFMPHKE